MITSKAPNPTITDSNSPYYTDLANFNSKWTLKGMIGNADAIISQGAQAFDSRLIRKGSISPGDYAYIGNREGMVTSVGAFDTKASIENVVGTFVVGETVTGGTSGETAVVVGVSGDTLLLSNVSGALTASEELTGGTSGATADYLSDDGVGGIISIEVNEDMRYLPQEYKNNSPEDAGYDADDSNRNRTVTYVLNPIDGIEAGSIVGGIYNLYTGNILVIGKRTADSSTWPKVAEDVVAFQTKFD